MWRELPLKSQRFEPFLWIVARAGIEPANLQVMSLRANQHASRQIWEHYRAPFYGFTQPFLMVR